MYLERLEELVIEKIALKQGNLAPSMEDFVGDLIEPKGGRFKPYDIKNKGMFMDSLGSGETISSRAKQVAKELPEGGPGHYIPRLRSHIDNLQVYSGWKPR